MGARIVVSTCPREGNYLPATLASLERAGALNYDREVLVDCPKGGGPWPRDPWDSRWPMLRIGHNFPSTRNNLWSAFRTASHLGADRLLYFEDDLVLTRNAVHRMAQVEIPADCAFMTFHDVKEREPGSKAGIYVTADAHGKDGMGFWGAQAMAFPLRTLLYLEGCDPFAVWKTNPQRHGDRTLEHYVSLSRWPRYAIHMPCLVKHMGDISVAHPGKKLEQRPTSNWPGEDYDATAEAL